MGGVRKWPWGPELPTWVNPPTKDLNSSKKISHKIQHFDEEAVPLKKLANWLDINNSITVTAINTSSLRAEEFRSKKNK